MYVIVFRYHAPLAEIDALRDAHYAHPQGVFAQGLALLAGPLEPRTGGLVLAEGPREAVEAAVASDPFVTSGAATAEVLRFRPVWRRDGAEDDPSALPPQQN
ncbi:YciI family protein [Streptomyces tropicalis]|uniref:YciI family protein n=1 Tax=Streptomyces tropicalis TaxID=3034234 RepID=A0ABT6A288_9ACTN|nr:YciI family protein [Streptomyces tropicalis]MDF3298582.1 YciI family protein [Streptomyces tropicalis]